MRLAFAVLLAAGSVGLAQERAKGPEVIPTRYGVPYLAKRFPQATPKQALESVLAAADERDFDYLVAHLLDPAFVDGRVADRAKQFERTVEADLARTRAAQRRNPGDVAPTDKLPDDPDKFRARVADDARQAAYRQLVKDVRKKLADDPEVMKDLRRFYRQGTFPETPGDAAKVTLGDLRDRALYLKKAGDRWYVENRQADEKGPDGKTGKE